MWEVSILTYLKEVGRKGLDQILDQFCGCQLLKEDSAPHCQLFSWLILFIIRLRDDVQRYMAFNKTGLLVYQFPCVHYHFFSESSQNTPSPESPCLAVLCTYGVCEAEAVMITLEPLCFVNLYYPFIWLELLCASIPTCHLSLFGVFSFVIELL